MPRSPDMIVPTDIALRHELADRYELGGEISRGGMAREYLARDRRHQRDVAVKVLLPELVETIGTERFLREIRLVARLQNRHTLPLFDSGGAAGQLYFVIDDTTTDTVDRCSGGVGFRCAHSVHRLFVGYRRSGDAHVPHRDPEHLLPQIAL